MHSDASNEINGMGAMSDTNMYSDAAMIKVLCLFRTSVQQYNYDSCMMREVSIVGSKTMWAVDEHRVHIRGVASPLTAGVFVSSSSSS